MSPTALTHHLLDQTIYLLPEKAMFWEEQGTLIIADVHLGKSGHFRKNGIAVPHAVNDQNLNKLSKLVHIWKPHTIIFLGDLFHSQFNDEWNAFKQWRIENENIEIILTIGNHDILIEEAYTDLGIKVTDVHHSAPFSFIHDLDEVNKDSTHGFLISGHIHPSIKLKGKGRQSITVPCFRFAETYAVLPAFGHFTGTHRIESTIKDQVFGVVDSEIIPIVG